MLAVLALLALLAGCSSSAPAGGQQKIPDPTPTKPPWSLTVSSFKTTTKASVGDSILATAIVANTGTGANPSTKFQFNGIGDYADLDHCKPKCTIDSHFGGLYAVVPGVGPGKKLTVQFEFIATRVGAAHWDVCVYDNDSLGEQVYCGEATTTIR